MIKGIVSNCWRSQLLEGIHLLELLHQAAERRFKIIELRQTCLGRYEQSPDHVPDATALLELPKCFPQLTFIVAVAFPFFSADADPHHPLLRAAVDAAEAVAGPGAPQLRLVDPTAIHQQADPPRLERAAQNVAQLTEILVKRGGVLSLENSRQPWKYLRALLNRARMLLGPNSAYLRLCYDPCNLALASKTPLFDRTTQSLRVSELSTIHSKQLRKGRLQPTVCDGDVDWSQQLTTLTSLGFPGPLLFELAPDDNIWAHLRRSEDYLNDIISDSFTFS